MQNLYNLYNTFFYRVKSIGAGLASRASRGVVGIVFGMISLAYNIGLACVGVGFRFNLSIHNYSRLGLPLKLNYVSRRYMNSSVALPGAAASSTPSPVISSKLARKGITKRISVPRATMDDFVAHHIIVDRWPLPLGLAIARHYRESLKFIQAFMMLCEHNNIKIPITAVSTLTGFSLRLYNNGRLDRNTTDHELLTPITDIFFQLFKDCDSTLDVLTSITQLSKTKMLRYLIHADLERDTLKLEELIKLRGSPRKKSKRLKEYFDKRLNTITEHEEPTGFAKDIFAFMGGLRDNK